MNSPSGDLLTALGSEMAKFFQAVRLYPSSHPERTKRREHLELAWKQASTRWTCLTLDFQRGAIRATGEAPAFWDSPLFRDLRRALSGYEPPSVLVDVRGPSDCPLVLFLEELGAGRTPSSLPFFEGHPQSGSSDTGEPRDNPESEGKSPGGPVSCLRGIWESILHRQGFPARGVEDLVRFVARQPTDGLVEPAVLWASENPADQQLVQALNAARLVYLAARSHGLGVRQIGEWMTAALLADIGMLAMPAGLAERPERLRPAEFQQIRLHPRLGSAALLCTPGTPLLAGVVAFEHHIRPDGQGYPQTAEEWKVCPASAVFQVADTYASLRSPRPFRPALEEFQARALLRRLSGRWFDGFSVELFLEQAIPQGCVTQESGIPLETAVF